jgi:hypothetical protein
MRRSTDAQQMISQPTLSSSRELPAPIRTAVRPKISLNIQNGIPIVRLRKSGRWKNRCTASTSRFPDRSGVSGSFVDIIVQDYDWYSVYNVIFSD